MLTNIDKTDRINRTVIGAIIMIAALVGLGKLFFMLVGLILIIEGVVGWCGIKSLMRKLNIEI